MKHTISIALVLGAIAGALLMACEDPRTGRVKDQLVGTWFAESADHGDITRRVLTMQADGHVHETVRFRASNGASDDHTREGEWSFDGANFKRKYTYVDGKPLTNAYFIYETYELRSVTDTELVAASKAGRGEVRFQRAGASQSKP